MKVEIKQLGPDTTEVNGTYRIERSHKRRSEIATKELLSDEVTAKHYQVGKPDAMNKPIKLGEKMDFIDWKNKNEREFCTYKKDKDGRFQKTGVYEDHDKAMSAIMTDITKGA